MKASAILASRFRSGRISSPRVKFKREFAVPDACPGASAGFQSPNSVVLERLSPLEVVSAIAWLIYPRTMICIGTCVPPPLIWL